MISLLNHKINSLLLLMFLASSAMAQVVKVEVYAGNGSDGFRDGTSSSAMFASPNGLAFDNKGNLYVSDSENNAIRKITPSGAVVTVAGGNGAGYQDGPSASSRFDFPAGIAVDDQGYVFVLDNNNHCIRRISPSGSVVTYAGAEEYGLVDGNLREARFYQPLAMCMDHSGNIYIAEFGNHTVRKISNGRVTTFAGNGVPGYKDGHGTNAQLNTPVGITVDLDNNIYVVDSKNQCVRKISPDGIVTTVIHPDFRGYKDLDGSLKKLNFTTQKDPYGNTSWGGAILADQRGMLYIANTGNNIILKVDLDKKEVSTIAGSGIPGFKDGLSKQASFNEPVELAEDKDGNIYVAEWGNHCVRKIKYVETFLVNGIVIEDSTGKPVLAEIEVVNNKNKEKFKLTTKNSGKFAQELKNGEYSIFIHKEGYLPYSHSFTINNDGANIELRLKKIVKKEKIVVHNIYFEKSSATIKPQSYPALDQMVEYLKAHPNLTIQINGHTDIGQTTQDRLIILSEMRAKAVAEYLIKHGILASRITWKGFGNCCPIASNDTPEGRMKNRRIEFEITGEK